MMKEVQSNNQSEMLNGEAANPVEETTVNSAPLNGSEEDGEEPTKRKSTPYERLSFDLSNDQRCLKEITLGKRIGFYRIRGELGSGNFSQVKMGIHALVKGKQQKYLKLQFTPMVIGQLTGIERCIFNRDALYTCQMNYSNI